MNRILLFLISLLGFSMVGCDKPGLEPDPVPVAYGTPYTRYNVSGKVVDELQHPLNHIQMTIGYGGNYIYTDSAGQYQATVNMSFTDSLTIIATDIDGEANGGEFESQMKRVGPDDNENQGGSGWELGDVTKEVNFELKRKE